MKKILAFIICTILLMSASTAIVFAEGETVPVESEIVTEEVAPDDGEYLPTLTSEFIVGYIKAHLEEISVIVTLILTVFYNMRKHKLLNKSIGTLNNNSVSIAENSNAAIQQALTEVGGMSNVVSGYQTEMAMLLGEIRRNNEEKKKLEDTIAEIDAHLKRAELANIEFSNELAELLVLANIPNSKKDELYARHLAAVDSISAVQPMEVKEDDNGQEE